MGKSPQDSDFPHGTITGYTHGCRCDECRAEKSRTGHLYYLANQDRIIEREKARYWRDPDSQHAYYRKHYLENKDRITERNKQYARDNFEAVAQRKRVWAQENSDRVARTKREWAERHRDELRAYMRKWRAENRESRRAHEHNREARKRGNGGSYTAEEVLAQFTFQGGVCFYCGRPLADKYEIDHYIPLSRGGPNESENLRVACPTCNHMKYNKMPPAWMSIAHG
jgi:5-methylcytosine-specific restriction endonuclease McrA